MRMPIRSSQQHWKQTKTRCERLIIEDLIHILKVRVCVCHRKAGETLPRPEQQGWTIAGRRSLLVCSTMMSCRCLCSYYHPKWAPVSTYITIITTGWSVCNICWNARSKHWWRAPFYLATHSASFGCCEGHMLNRLMRGHKLKISYRQ